MRKSAASIVSENLTALMRATPELRSSPKLAKRIGSSKSTVERIRDGVVACQVDTLQSIADAFGLEPWQLLVEGLQPTNPPLLREDDEKLKDLYRSLSMAMDNLRRYGDR